MFSLLVVEDERWVREGLCKTIDWRSEGIDVIRDAGDGEEAILLLEDGVSDIIITDIRMPGMDGITLLQEIRRRRMECKVIMISGFSDFDYARIALRNGAIDYVLKPIRPKDLLIAVRRCIETLKQDRNHREQMDQLSGTLRESLPLARIQLLGTIMTGGLSVHPAGEIEQLWRRMGIELDPRHLYTIAIIVHQWGSKVKRTSDRRLLLFALSNMAEEMGNRYGSTIAFPMQFPKASNDDADLVVLSSSMGRMERSEWSVWIPLFIAKVRELLGLTISIGCSREGDVRSLPSAYEEALHASARYFYEGYDKVHFAKVSVRNQTGRGFYYGPSGWDSRLARALRQGERNVIESLIKELVNHIAMHQHDCSPLTMLRGIRVLLDSAYRKLTADPSQSQFGRESELTSFKLPFCTLNTLKETLLDSIRLSDSSVPIVKHRMRISDRALQFVNQQFDKGITLSEVAAHLDLHPSYFSKMFHEEVGETFSKYIIRHRMEKAKQLLRETALKIYEISAQVGYNDVKYFTKLFKEAEGVSPAQYRENRI